MLHVAEEISELLPEDVENTLERRDRRRGQIALKLAEEPLGQICAIRKLFQGEVVRLAQPPDLLPYLQTRFHGSESLNIKFSKSLLFLNSTQAFVKGFFTRRRDFLTVLPQNILLSPSKGGEGAAKRSCRT